MQIKPSTKPSKSSPSKPALANDPYTVDPDAEVVAAADSYPDLSYRDPYLGTERDPDLR